jgi:hypothetical protein
MAESEKSVFNGTAIHADYHDLSRKSAFSDGRGLVS